MSFLIQPHQAKHLLHYSHLFDYLEFQCLKHESAIDIPTHALLLAILQSIENNTPYHHVNKSKWFSDLDTSLSPSFSLHHLIKHKNWSLFLSELQNHKDEWSPQSHVPPVSYGLEYLILFFKNDILAFETENEIRSQNLLTVLTTIEEERDKEEQALLELKQEAVNCASALPFNDEDNFDYPEDYVHLPFTSKEQQPTPPETTEPEQKAKPFLIFPRYHLFPFLLSTSSPKPERHYWISHLHARHIFSMAEEHEDYDSLPTEIAHTQKLIAALKLLDIHILKIENCGVCGYKVKLTSEDETKLRSMMPIPKRLGALGI